MHRVAARLLRHTYDLRDIEIGGGADAGEGHGLVGGAEVQRTHVVLGMDGDGNAEIRRRASDTDGDFAPVGDQQAADRHRLSGP